jgi:hypothetical protein
MRIAVEDIEQAIMSLSKEHLTKFRKWYEEFDSEKWDEQIEKDSLTGKLDHLIELAVSDHKTGKTKKL